MWVCVCVFACLLFLISLEILANVKTPGVDIHIYLIFVFRRFSSVWFCFLSYVIVSFSPFISVSFQIHFIAECHWYYLRLRRAQSVRYVSIYVNGYWEINGNATNVKIYSRKCLETIVNARKKRMFCIQFECWQERSQTLHFTYNEVSFSRRSKRALQVIWQFLKSSLKTTHSTFSIEYYNESND